MVSRIGIQTTHTSLHFTYPRQGELSSNVLDSNDICIFAQIILVILWINLLIYFATQVKILNLFLIIF